MGKKYHSTTIQRVIDVLNLFKEHNKLSFTDMKELLGYNKSTLFRVLYMLEENNYLIKDENRRYSLGLNVFILGNRFSKENQLKRIATPYLKDITNKTKLTTQIGIIEGKDVVILNKIDPPNSSIKMFSRIGAIIPAHCTGLGKALLAYSSKKTVQEIINFYGLKRFTPQTITTSNELFEELKQIKDRGYAIDDSEHEKHIKCVAVPVLNGQEQAVVAISITGLFMDFDEENIKWFASLLKDAAMKISKKLKFKI